MEPQFPLQWHSQTRSYWIPGSSTPAASEKGSPFVSPLKKKVFQEVGVTKIGWYDIGTFTTLESNKSQRLTEPEGAICTMVLPVPCRLRWLLKLLTSASPATRRPT